MVEKVDIEVWLSGDLFVVPLRVGEEFAPLVRRSPLNMMAVRHYETKSSWEGTSESIDDELRAWHRALKECLAKQIEKHIREDLIHHLSTYSGKHPLQRVVNFASTSHSASEFLTSMQMLPMNPSSLRASLTTWTKCSLGPSTSR